MENSEKSLLFRKSPPTSPPPSIFSNLLRRVETFLNPAHVCCKLLYFTFVIIIFKHWGLVYVTQ